MEEKPTIFVEAIVKCQLSASACFEMPEDYTEEELKEKAKSQIIDPVKIMQAYKNLLRNSFNINVSDGDIWTLDNIEVNV